MKNVFLLLVLFLCFLAAVYVIDSVVFFFLHPLLRIVRETLNSPNCSFVALRVSSLLAIAATSFGFGFLKYIHCRFIGFAAALYLVLTWLGMLHSVYFNTSLKVSDPAIMYLSLIYILSIVAAYFVGCFSFSFSKKMQNA